MNVLMLTSRFQGLTDPEAYIYELSRTLVTEGHNVAVVAQAAGAAAQQAMHHGVDVIRFHQVKSLRWRVDIAHLVPPAPVREIYS